MCMIYHRKNKIAITCHIFFFFFLKSNAAKNSSYIQKLYFSQIISLLHFEKGQKLGYMEKIKVISPQRHRTKTLWEGMITYVLIHIHKSAGERRHI